MFYYQKECTREMAIRDTQEIWKLMSESCCSKDEAIGYLYSKGKISLPSYKNDCPLCYAIGCNNCPFPDYDDNLKCCSRYSTYNKWNNSKPGSDEEKQYSKEMYELTLTFK